MRAILVTAARDGRPVSYSELLGVLGHRFTRPKMRALCCTLDAIDAAGELAGEPGLAVLVVRESDGLPGQGWWTAAAERWGYAGLWTGAEAATFVSTRQQAVFDHWSSDLGQAAEQAPPPAVAAVERRKAMAQKGAGGNPGAVTTKGGDPGSGAKSKTTGGKGGGGRSGGSKSGGGGNSGGGSRGGAK